MQPITIIEAVAAPLDQANVDTDQVIPARYLQKPRDGTLGRFLFHNLRFNEDESIRPEFILNRPPFDAARILVAKRNFGCGSSRENAVWAMTDYGFQAVLAPSFGDIFRSNGLKNGLLPVVLPEPVIENVLASLIANPGQTIAIDLPAQIVTLPDGSQHPFEIDPFSHHCLINGIDELAYTLSQLPEIEAFERRHGRRNA